MTIVVSDTGPLLHLHQAGVADLIAELGEIYVTPQVWTELQRHSASYRQNGPPTWLRLSTPTSRTLQQAFEWLRAGLLDEGEAEALAYAQEIEADLFLSDDTAARTMGQSLGQEVRGSLGIILYLAAKGVLNRNKAFQVLDNLENQSTLWMSAKVRNAAHQALRETFDRQ